MADGAPRVGIFGGSFDPVHDAHVALARLALDALALDELIWVPAGQPWQKHRDLAPAVDRAAMVRLAIEGEPRFVLSSIELEHAGPSYTVDTVRALRAGRLDADWYLLIGHDQYIGFETWHEWRALLQLVTLAVADRTPDGANAASAGADSVGLNEPASPDPEVQAFAHSVVALPSMPVSSTEIRARLKGGHGIADRVPPRVARYIDQHHLYRSRPLPVATQELNGHS